MKKEFECCDVCEKILDPQLETLIECVVCKGINHHTCMTQISEITICKKCYYSLISFRSNRTNQINALYSSYRKEVLELLIGWRVEDEQEVRP